MFSARTAGLTAVGCSLGALGAVFFYLPMLVLKIGQINEQLKVDSDEFRALADEAWTELISAKNGIHPAILRARRQAYGSEPLPKAYPLRNTYAKQDASVTGPTCSCNAQNQCPAGPPGPPGKPGEDGLPGARGGPGGPGLPGISPPVTIDPNAGCRVCPHGPSGPPGPSGEPGAPGPEGMPGPPGRKGEDGRAGYPGNPGIPGETGKSGKIGEAGLAGRDGVRGQKGSPGPKGETGPQGPKGPDGYPGTDGQRGNDGSNGPSGPTGAIGPPGSDGQPGNQGTVGAPGEDAQYCPCPSRSSGVDKPSTYEQPKPSTYEQPSAAVVKSGYEQPSAAVLKNAYEHTAPGTGMVKTSGKIRPPSPEPPSPYAETAAVEKAPPYKKKTI